MADKLEVYVVVRKLFEADPEFVMGGGSSTPARIHAYTDEKKARTYAKQHNAYVVRLYIDDGEVIDPNE